MDGCWRGTESRALPLQQNEAPDIAGGCSAGRELPSGCGSLCCQTCPSFSTTKCCFLIEIHRGSVLGCPFKLLGLFSSALSLSNSALSTTISVMFHVRPTRYKCFPDIYLKSEPGFPNPSTTLTIPAHSFRLTSKAKEQVWKLTLLAGTVCCLPM